jgi:hypothetical protein
VQLGVPEAWLTEPTGPGPLRRYFRRLGFERLGRSPFYAMPTALVTPTAEELLRAGAGRRSAMAALLERDCHGPSCVGTIE